EGTADGQLGRPAQFLEELGDMVLVVQDAEFLLDDQGDAGAGPDLASEAVSLRAVPEELRKEVLLLAGQAGWTARRGPRSQRLRTAVGRAGEPAADGLLADTQSSSDGPLPPALLLQVQRPKPPPLAPVVRDGVPRFHTLFYA